MSVAFTLAASRSTASPAAANSRARVRPSSPVTCPKCGRGPGYCCLTEMGTPLRTRPGKHPERLALEQAAAVTS